MTGPGGTQAVPPQLPGWIHQHKKQLAVCAGAVVAAYLGYRAYHSKSAAQLGKVKRTVQDYLSTLSAISGSVSVVANDLHTFLNSDADELPRSLRQLNKLLQSPDVQATVTNTATSLATSLSAVVANATSSSGSSSSEPVLQTVLDAVLSDRGRSLVGMAVGLATKNATATFCEFLERTMQRQQGPAAEPGAPGSSSAAAAAAATGPTDSAYLNTALSLLASEQGERVLSLLITKSIKTAVSTYIDCTTGYNVYEDMVASIAKQEHRDAVSDIMSRITAAFCRELAAAYRRATRASQQQHHHHHHHSAQQQQQQQQHVHTAGGQPAAAPLSCSSASSSSNSVISLAGHLQTSTTEGLHLCKAPGPVVGRYSSDDAGGVAAACAAELQPRLSAGSANGCGNGAQSLLGAPTSNRLSAAGNSLKANAPRVALNASTAGATQPQPLLPPQPFSAAGLLASQPAVALDLLANSSCSGGSGSAWWRPLVDLAREQHVRSLTLDVVRSATREATRSTWESLFSSSTSTSSGSGAGGLTAWLFGGAVGAAEPSLQQQQQWAMYRMYAVCTVLISLFMYAVSPRVIAV